MERPAVIFASQVRSRRLRRITGRLALLAGSLAIFLALPADALAQACPPADGAPGAAGAIASCSQSEPASLPPDGPALGVGNPVDLATGAKYERRVDIALSDTSRPADAGGDLARVLALQPGLPFVFSRHFIAGADDRGLGPGWRHGFDTRLAFRGGPRPRLQILQPDGRRIRFERGALGRFVAARPVDGVIVALRGGSWQWRWPNGRRLRFDAGGRLLRIDAVNGDRLDLRYVAGQLADVSDRGGRRLLLRWRAGRLRAVEAPALGRVAFGFDRDGRLVSARAPDGRLERYWYEDKGDPTRLTGAGPADEVRSRFAYDAAGRIARSLAVGAPAAAELHLDYTIAAGGESGTTRVRSPRGEATYDWRRVGPDNVARLVASPGVAGRRCPPTGMDWTWNEAGLLVGAGALGYRHDDAGRVLAVHRAPAGSAAIAPLESRVEIRRYREPDAPGAGIPAEVAQPSVAPGRWRRARID